MGPHLFDLSEVAMVGSAICFREVPTVLPLSPLSFLVGGSPGSYGKLWLQHPHTVQGLESFPVS